MKININNIKCNDLGGGERTKFVGAFLIYLENGYILILLNTNTFCLNIIVNSRFVGGVY